LLLNNNNLFFLFLRIHFLLKQFKFSYIGGILLRNFFRTLNNLLDKSLNSIKRHSNLILPIDFIDILPNQFRFFIFLLFYIDSLILLELLKLRICKNKSFIFFNISLTQLINILTVVLIRIYCICCNFKQFIKFHVI